MWWHVPVVLAIWEAKAGELLEPRRQRLQRAGIVPLHSSLATERDSVSKQTNKQKPEVEPGLLRGNYTIRALSL